MASRILAKNPAVGKDMIVALLVILFMLSAFFSSAETVLFSLTGAQRARIKERNPSLDRLIGLILADTPVLFSTLLVGNTFVNFAIATIGYRTIDGLYPDLGWIAVPLMTVLLLMFGEITPKRLALKFTEEIAPAYAVLLWIWRWVLSPFNVFLRFTSRAFAPALERERRALSDEELMSVMESAAENGEVSMRDVKMVEGVLRLSELCANDEMTPRVDIEGYDIERDRQFRENALANARHRYLPVYRRNHDMIEGIVDRDTGKFDDALFVPETVTLDDLLLTFARSKKPMAVVLDEYGGTAGIITPDDIFGLIIGREAFGNSSHEPEIVKSGENTWDIDASASLDQVNRELDLELEAEDADRISGWVQFHAERLPHVGQQIEADGCRATILRRRRRRVMAVRLEVISRPQADSDEQILADTDDAVERTQEDL